MPGFVDVSKMSDLEIKRLGQIDEDDEPRVNRYAYRNPYAYRKPVAKKPAFSYSADRVWGAAVVAFRINNGYVKAIAPDVPGHKTNRQLIDELLQNNSYISEADLEEGSAIRRYFKGITFKLLEGQVLSPFLRNAMEIAGIEDITNNLGIGTIASLPATYKKMTERDKVERKIHWAQGGLIGSEGDKITQTIELIKRVWSEKWCTWYYTGLSKDDQVLFFAYKGELKIGEYVTIEGKVKAHRDNSTQLNRVKVI